MLCMDELPSAQFRKVYAKLTKPTVVTVNGHAIGIWQPGARAFEATVTKEEVAALGNPRYIRVPMAEHDSFGAPRAYPKPSQRKG